MNARGGVHEIAGHETLTFRAHGDRRFAGDDSRARLQSGRAGLALQRGDRLDQLEAGANGALGGSSLVRPVRPIGPSPRRR